MTGLQSITFDNAMEALSAGVYKGNQNLIPKNWLKIDGLYNTKSGFHGEAFYKNGTIVISIRGTDEKFNDLIKEDIGRLGIKKLPNQYSDAQKFYEIIKRDFPNQKIVFTGHSLGGSLAQLMGNKTGCETITFNAYGIADIVKNNINSNGINIRNYGHIDDTVFNLNLDNQLGSTYIIGYGKQDNYITKSPEGNYTGGLSLQKYHSIENMGNLENAIKYIPNRLKGRAEINVDTLCKHFLLNKTVFYNKI